MPESADEPPVQPPAEPPPLPPAPPEIPAQPEGVPVGFHGDAREYFRIWIVNLLLTILTLGIFAAWAKVRRRRYLRGNIDILGHRFAYTARPLRLLIGNVLIVALFLAYSLFGSVYPWIRLGAVVVGLCLLPWIVVRSFAFNAHHTVYRGVRFRFHPSLSAALMTYLLQGFLIVVTFGFYYPAWTRAKRDFTINRHRYGTGYFRFNAGAGPFYSAYFTAFAVVFGAMLVAMFFGLALRASNPGPQTYMWIGFGLYIPAVIYARLYLHAQLFNVVWNATSLDQSRFSANMSVGRWIALEVGNWLAIVGTAGLLYPWAVMRAARYTASCLTFYPSPEFFRLQGMAGGVGSAVGDTAAEFVGLDFGL